MPVFDGEFFVFLSGLVCAFAYRGAFTRRGFWGCLRVVIRRVRWLYIYQIVATLLVLVILYATWPFTIYPEYTPPTESAVVQMLRVLTLSLQPRFLDILMLYMTLMLFIPVVLALLNSGHVRILFAILGGCWLIADCGLDAAVYQQIAFPAILVSHSGVIRGNFNPWSYALLFYGAFYLGWRFKEVGRDRFIRTVIVPDTRLFVISVVITLMLAVLEVGKRVIGTPMWVYNPPRDVISPMGLISTVTASYIVYYLLCAEHRHRTLQAIAVRLKAVLTIAPLVTIGSSSLFVYSVHGLLIMAGVATLTAGGWLGNRWATDVAVLSTGVALWALASLKRRYLPTLP